MSDSSGSRGPQWPVSPEWKAMIRSRMAQMKLRQVDLARKVGTSTAQISLLFGKTRSSGMVPRIHKALGLPPPEMSAISSEVDEMKVEIDENWPLLTEEERELVLKMVRVATRRRG